MTQMNRQVESIYKSCHPCETTRIMDMMTITEALSEVNLIKKKIEAKQTKIKSALTRASHAPDPFESEGGSAPMIRQESQALIALQNRLIKIRSRISAANISNEITIGSHTRSIHDWLTWKREVSKNAHDFIKTIHQNVKIHMDNQAKNPQVYKDDKQETHLVKWVINLDYANWIAADAAIEEILETLDGKLSLKNATLVIEL